MKKNITKLTANEQLVMNLFWEKNEPMTSIDLTDYLDAECKEWKNGYLHNLLKALLDKGFLQVSDIIQVGRRYAKLYEPAFSKEEYAAKLVIALHIQKNSVSKVAYALAKEVSEADSCSLISELETIIKELKKEQN